MPNYIAFVEKAPDSDFGVNFPDFPGCITAGATLQEARAMAEEALQLHVAGMQEDNVALPAPSRFDDLMQDCASQAAFAFIVKVG